MSRPSPLAAAALDQTDTPFDASAALLAAAVEVMAEAVGADHVWTAIDVAITAQQAEWRRVHGN